MQRLVTLGVLAGGFLMSPPPRAVLTTLAWVVPRAHPVLGALTVLAVVLAWRADHD